MLATTIVAGGCGGPSADPAAWVIEVPADVPVRELAATPADATARAEVVLERDLLITGSGAPETPLFYYPGYFSQVIAVDPGGNIHVLDVGRQQVESFDRHGHHLRTSGRRGQGPGELERASKIVRAGDELIVADFPTRRLGIWGLDGTHRATAPIEMARSFVKMAGGAGGDLVVSYDEPRQRGGTRRHVARMRFRTEERLRYATTPGLRWDRVAVDGGRTLSVQHPQGVGDFVVAADGSVYVTPGAQYQIHAYAAEGSMLWATRVAWPAAPFDEAARRAAVDEHREAFPQLGAGDFEWPEREPVVDGLALDGHGNIWVLPYRSAADLEAHPLRPVDVFSSSGEQIFSGLIDRLWQQAQGEHVYRLEQDEASGDWQVARYRLPFDFEQ